ncbi:MAG: hypothetical protein FWH48_06885 [Oscillospiraceae bacterium]|nr:hypothetical protein [Oscillospiraceae bacterium]
MPYFENVVKSRQIIVLVVACFISGLILRGTRRFDKSKKKPLEPVSPSAKGNIIFFIFVSIVLFATVFNQYGPKNFPIYLYNIFDNTSAGFTKLANESYAYLYDRLESEEEYIKIPTLKRTEELYKKAINYYGQGKYLAALSIFQSKNNITEKDYYIDRIEQFAIGIINNANIDDYLPIKNVVLNLNDIEKKESYLTKIADTIPEYLKKAKYDVALSLVELIADTKSIDKYAPYIDIYIALSKNEFVNITEELFDEFPIDAAIKLFDDEQYLAALAIAVFNYEREKDISVELMQDIYDIISGEAKTGIYNFGGDVFSVLNKFEEFKGYFMEKEPNDSSYRATRIFLNTAYSANLHADNETEQDWFTFNLPVDGMVNIVLYTEQNYQRQLYWDLTLYKNSQIPDDKDIIAREYVPGTANETNTGDIELKKGQYYICIKSNEDWSDSEYQVIAQFLPLYVEN